MKLKGLVLLGAAMLGGCASTQPPPVDYSQRVQELQSELRETRRQLEQEKRTVRIGRSAQAQKPQLDTRTQHILDEWETLTTAYNRSLTRGHNITSAPLSRTRHYHLSSYPEEIADRFVHKYHSLDPVSRVAYLTDEVLRSWTEIEELQQAQPSKNDLFFEAQDRGYVLMEQHEFDEVQNYISSLEEQTRQMIVQEPTQQEVQIDNRPPPGVLNVRLGENTLVFPTPQYLCNYTREKLLICMDMRTIIDDYQ